MSLLDVLVVVDNAACVPRRMALIAALAKRTELRITGVYATGLPSTAFADLNGWAQLVDAYMTAQRDEAAKAQAAFSAELGRLQLAGSWLYRESDLTSSINVLARLHDLTVLGQPDPAGDAGNTVRPEEVVLAAGGPVLVIPYAGDFAELGRHVLVAWNGTRESARALHDARFLIEGAETVTVLEVDRPGDEEGIPDLAAADVVAALARRGIKATAEATVSDGTPVADIILSSAADLTADLVVMGAWGHSRLREFVLGGVSRGILQEMTVPVLMSH
jgi:nucleotide-binding universal stress UspA family protein